jgi:hypothetical protein
MLSIKAGEPLLKKLQQWFLQKKKTATMNAKFEPN